MKLKSARRIRMTGRLCLSGVVLLFLFSQNLCAESKEIPEWRSYGRDVLKEYQYPSAGGAKRWIELYAPKVSSITDGIAKSEILMKLGGFYYSLGDNEKAVQYFTQSKESWLVNGYEDQAMKASAVLGALYESQNRYEDAITVLEEGLRYSRFPKVSHGELSLRLLLSARYMESEQYHDALRQSIVVVAGNMKLGQWEHEAKGSYIAAVAFARLGQQADATVLLRRSYQLYDQRYKTYKNEKYRLRAVTRAKSAKALGIDVSSW